MISFFLIVNARGQTRIRKYYPCSGANDVQNEADIIRQCLSREDHMCNFFDYQKFTIVHKKYASLYFVMGVSADENELGILEFIQNIIETFNEYFQKISEQEIMVNIDRVYMILEEMISGGRIVEGSRSRILAPLRVMDQETKK